MTKFNLASVDPSWHECLNRALTKMDAHYLEELYNNTDWLPGPNQIFNAFSIPLNQVNFVLMGESPYPRAHSANGYAFWDAAVNQLWTETGLSKAVNRATSLRNLIKMLLITEGKLDPQQTGQAAIAQVNKQGLVQTNQELFNNFLHHGFLLLNATLILKPDNVQKDARAWQPFIREVLWFLFDQNPSIQLILFGNIANTLDKFLNYKQIKRLYAEHPYNISFIHNENVMQFFQPLHLLRAFAIIS